MATQAEGLHIRILSGSKIPSSTGLPGIPQPVTPRRFVVEVMYHGNNTGTLSEVPIDDTVLDRVVGDIISGQHAHVVRVFELRDVSREIAHAVAAKAEDDGTDIHSDLANFLALYRVNVPRPAPDREYEWEPDY